MRKQRPSASVSVPMIVASSALALAAFGVQQAQSVGSSSASSRKHQLARATAAVVPTSVATTAPPTTAPPPPPPPSTTTTTAPATTTTTAPKPAASAVGATSSVAGGVWAQLRQCESTDNYQDNTGNGFYGAYQFTQQTWDSLGLSGLPSAAPPAVQDDAAKRLQARDGWGAWPACSRKLGLS